MLYLAIGWPPPQTVYHALMGMFAETANVDYHLLFADQGKQTSVSACSKQMEVAIFR
jgi:hypothetical protein